MYRANNHVIRAAASKMKYLTLCSRFFTYDRVKERETHLPSVSYEPQGRTLRHATN